MRSEKISLIQDVIKICKYKCWDNGAGNKKAREIIDSIHDGKYGSKEGIWVQVDEVMNILEGEPRYSITELDKVLDYIWGVEREGTLLCDISATDLIEYIKKNSNKVKEILEGK